VVTRVRPFDLISSRMSNGDGSKLASTDTCSHYVINSQNSTSTGRQKSPDAASRAILGLGCTGFLEGAMGFCANARPQNEQLGSLSIARH
jgi:hypothetical protein